MDKSWVIVSLVEVLEDAGKDFGLLGWQVDAHVGALEELAPQRVGEVGGVGEDVFVSSEQALVRADNDGDNGRSEAGRELVGHGTVDAHGFHLVDDAFLLPGVVAKRPLRLFGYLARTVL